MNIKLPGNGDIQTGIALILVTLAVALVPGLDVVKENLQEIIIIVLGALFTSAVRAK